MLVLLGIIMFIAIYFSIIALDDENQGTLACCMIPIFIFLISFYSNTHWLLQIIILFVLIIIFYLINFSWINNIINRINYSINKNSKYEEENEIEGEYENSQLININNADKDDLLKLPGFDDEIADKIIKLRKNGYYIRKPNDLMAFGIPLSLIDAVFNKVDIPYYYKNYKQNYSETEINEIYEDIIKENNKDKIEDKTGNNEYNKKININKSSEKELSKIPGLNKTIAHKIIILRRKNIYITKADNLLALGLPYSKLSQVSNYIIISPEHEKCDFPYNFVEIKRILEDDNYHKDSNSKEEHDIIKLDRKIEINKVSCYELSKIPELSSQAQRNICTLRRSGITFKDIGDLRSKVYLSAHEMSSIRLNVDFSIDKKPDKRYPEKYFNHNKNRQTKNDKVNNKRVIEKEDNKKVKEEDLKKDEQEETIEKIDINKASKDELTKLPGINIVLANKIIQMRQSGNYIQSSDDLKEKLNLKDYQINQLKDYIIIEAVKSKQMLYGRQLDI